MDEVVEGDRERFVVSALPEVVGYWVIGSSLGDSVGDSEGRWMESVSYFAMSRAAWRGQPPMGSDLQRGSLLGSQWDETSDGVICVPVVDRSLFRDFWGTIEPAIFSFMTSGDLPSISSMEPTEDALSGHRLGEIPVDGEPPWIVEEDAGFELGSLSARGRSGEDGEEEVTQRNRETWSFEIPEDLALDRLMDFPFGFRPPVENHGMTFEEKPERHFALPQEQPSGVVSLADLWEVEESSRSLLEDESSSAEKWKQRSVVVWEGANSRRVLLSNGDVGVSTVPEPRVVVMVGVAAVWGAGRRRRASNLKGR
ncbi:hypothetical protein HNR46_001981 [Haloferula luteola]|uniref:PEP-CTERM protein-sorting domain-containing protein n=1 Tax=Haloferula luteola TaxID=595692 RepID=A0A840V166_9BACT|nr:hypothetical protein [Haloferula luteola]MBB5351742.1 hypothetical protein [Haloferula luteola]